MDVKLQVILDAVDKMTAPVNKALGATQRLSPALSKIRSEISQLNQLQSEINGFKHLTLQMQQTDQQVNQSNRALIKLEQQIRHTDVPTQTMLRTQEKLERSHVKLLQKQESQQQSHDIYQKELTQSGINIKQLDAAEIKLQATLKKTQTELKKQSSSYDQARQTFIELNKTQKKLDGFKKLSNQLENTRLAFKHQGQEVERLQRRFNATRKPTQQLAQQLQKAADTLGQLGLKEKQAQQGLQQLKVELNNAGVSTTSLGNAQQTLKQKINAANTALQRQTQILQQNTARQNAMVQARTRMDRSLQTLSDVSLIAGPSMQVGRGMVQGAAAPVQTAMSFEKEMSKVAALTRLKKTDTSYQRLEAQSRELGATTSFKATEVAQGQQFMAMAGFDNKQIEGAMGGVLDLAKASGKDLARVANISSNILSGFGLKAEEMGRVGDVLTATFTRTNVDLGMLGYSMKYAAPIARTLGVSLEEAAAMSGLLGNVGIQGSQAGTSMRGIFNRLAAQPKPVAKALSSLNINAKDKDNNLRPVIEILGDVARATENMGTAERATHFKNIAGMEAGSAFAELVTQQGAESITKFVKVLEDSQGEARRVAQTMADNLDGDMTTLSSAYQDAQISMGNIFLPTLREVVKWVTEATRSVGDWIQRNPKLVETLTTIALVIGSVIAAMGGLSLVLVAVLGPIAMMRYALRMTMLQLTPMSAAVGRFSASLTLMARNAIPIAIAAMRGLSIAMLANPIGLAVAAMVVGASLLIYHWDKVKSFFSGFWSGLSSQFIEPFSRLIPSISNSFADAIAPLKAAFDPLMPMFDWLSSQYQAAKKALGNLFGSVSDLGKAGDNIGLTLGQKLLKSVTGAVFTAINYLAKGIKVISPYMQAFVSGFASGIGIIASSIGTLISFAAEVTQGIALFVQDLWKWSAGIREAFTPLGWIGGQISTLLSWLGSFTSVSDDANQTALSFASSLGVVASGVVGFMAISKATQAVIMLSRALWATVAPMLGFVARLAIMATAAASMAFASLASGFMVVARAIGFMSMMLAANPIVLIVSAIAGAAYLIYSNWGTLKTWMASFWNTITPAFSVAWELIKTLFSWSPLGLVITHWQPLMDWFSTLPAKFSNFGSMLMKGLSDGIMSGVKMVRDKVVGVGKKIKSWFTGETQIKSPSRVFIRYGQYINEGLAIGLQQSEQLPIKQSIKVAKMLPEGISKAANDSRITKPTLRLVKKFTAATFATLIAGASSLPMTAAAQSHQAVLPSGTQQSINAISNIMPPEQMQAIVEQQAFIQETTEQQAIQIPPVPMQSHQGFTDQSTITINVNIDGSQGEIDEYRLAAIIRQEIEREKRESDYRRRTQQFDGHGSL